MKTKIQVDAYDGDAEASCNIAVSGTFDGVVLSNAEMDFIIVNMGKMLNNIYKHREKLKNEASKRERDETGDDVSIPGFITQGGGKIGTC